MTQDGEGDGVAVVAQPRALGSRYTLTRVLGSGAMGEVWLAVDVQTDEQLAAKLLRPEFTRDTALVGRFIQERAILLELVHPHVVRVRDLVVEGSDLAIVMDLVEGGDLRGLLKERGRLSPSIAVGVTVDALDGLAAAHARGILHRDVKPDNVLLEARPTGYEQFVAKLSDFGIARLAQETTVKMTGLLGTAEYMAPEVLVDEIASAAADVYGAGVMLYEFLAGHTPFTGGGNHYAVARRHELALPPRLELPPALWDVLAAMLDKDPARRPAAGTIASQLRALLPSLAGMSALPPSSPPSAWTSVDGRMLTSEHGGRSVSIRGQESAVPAEDANRTFIRGENPLASPVVLPLEAAPVWQPALGTPEVDPNATYLGGAGSQTQLRPSRVRERAIDTLDLVAAESVKRSRWRHPAVLAGCGLLLVLLVGGGVLFLLSGGKGHAKKSVSASTVARTSTASASAPSDTLASGLTINRAASLDLGTDQLTTTITYSASGSAALRGPFFESVPAPAGTTGCPAVIWKLNVPTVQDVLLSDPGACGWTIGAATTVVTSSQPLTTSYTQTLNPGSTDATQAIQAYAAAEESGTTTALTNHNSDADYAVQRIASIQVLITGGGATAGKPVDVAVVPVWTSGPDGAGDDLYRNDDVNDPLAQTLGGSAVLSSDTCAQQLEFGVGHVPQATTVGQNCTINATVGNLSATSEPFSIGLKGQ